LPAITACKGLGLKALVVDRDPKAPGMEIADVGLCVDIIDIDRVVEIAREYKIIGAMTMQSDIGVPTVGAVVDALCLPGPGRHVAERCSNKILMRKALAAQNVPQPKFKVVSNQVQLYDAVDKLGLPCVIKAPDNSGSRGVVKVNSDQDISDAFAEAKCYTRGQYVLVEEYIQGVEVGAQAFSVDCRCVKVLIHDDVISSPPYMIPVGHAFPSSLTADQVYKTKRAVKVCTEALGINSGPSNIDLIIDEEGNPRIIEIGARIGATCLPELVYYHTGINWTVEAVKAACGIDVDLKTKRSQACAAFILHSPKDGVIEDYEIPPVYLENKDVIEWEMTVMRNDQVSFLRKGTDRIGKVITRGQTSKEAMTLARDFYNSIKWDIRKFEA